MDPSLTVLLAEDDENDAFLMQRAFHMLGVMRPLHVVRDGSDAIDYLAGRGQFADRTIHPPANYVILDLKMPGTDGFQVLKFLQEHNELIVIPTVVWSSSTDLRDVKRAYCLGANGFLRKPNSLEELRQMVEVLSNYWSLCEVPITETAPFCEDLKDQDPFSGTHGAWRGTTEV